MCSMKVPKIGSSMLLGRGGGVGGVGASSGKAWASGMTMLKDV